jgi:hypothetical protein
VDYSSYAVSELELVVSGAFLAAAKTKRIAPAKRTSQPHSMLIEIRPDASDIFWVKVISA